ncbi:MAG: hypothetical protein JSR44_04910 [Spirochaetes bacterium]|nr:hypothetical protein [Spirochaetota bacterium]
MKNTLTRFALVLGIFTSSTLFAQSENLRFYERLKLDLGAFAIAPPAAVPSAFGGAFGIGYALKDIDIQARFLYLSADNGRNQIMAPNLLVDYRMPIMPNFLTLLPYVSGGVWMGKVMHPATGGYGSNNSTFYAEAGIGCELMATNEISLVTRLGWGYAFLRDDPDSLNTTGPTISAAVRYNFGHNHNLDF